MDKTDFLVIGSGIAGLSFALEVANHGSVLLITKKRDTESNTNYAQGGIAVVRDSADSFEKHFEDTIRVGAGLSVPRAVMSMVREGPARIDELIQRGVEFSYYWKNDHRELALGREGGHSRARIVHKADHTGREVEKTLIERCKDNSSITIEEHSTAVDFAVDNKGCKPRCVGVYVLTRSGRIRLVRARVIMLASGGCGHVYLHTTNPAIATGDGIAMAYRAGARVNNLEFMQFHPTALYPRTTQAFLISEAVRGFGGILRTRDGEAFMQHYHAMGDLAPRDIVARAIDNEMKVRGDDFVYLDVTGRHAKEVRERFPSIYKHCLTCNIDITREWIPVVPAAHYMCGGVVTDLTGRTTLKGLFAAGEVASSGVHGANRLASNSLLEAVVFSHRAAKKAIEELPELPLPAFQAALETPGKKYSDEEWVLVSHDLFQIRKLMWDYVGIVRSTLRLERARRRVDLIRREVDELCSRSRLTTGLVELRNIALVASLIIRCGLKRHESRGLHFTTDYPEADNTRKPRNSTLRIRNNKRK